MASPIPDRMVPDDELGMNGMVARLSIYALLGSVCPEG